MDNPIKLGDFAEFTNDKAAQLIFAVKRPLDEFGVENITIHTHYDIDFWREIVEVDVLLESGERIRHREKIEVKDLHVDVDSTLDKMISKFEAWFWAKASNMKMQIDNETSELVHTHYLSDQKWLCEDPSRLDNPGDFVVMGNVTQGKPFCRICQQVLTAHNAKEGYLEKLQISKYGIAYVPPAQNEAFRGLVWGAILSSLIWLAILTLFFMAVGH